MRQPIEVINGPLYQWDIGRKVRINCPEAVELHLAPDGAENAAVLEIREENGQRVADAPDEFLQHGGRLYAYLVKVSDAGEYTKHAHTLYVHHRPKPEDYVYTPTEIKRWEALEERVAVLENPVQADLNQNDETAPDYVKGRTHWVEKREYHNIPMTYNAGQHAGIIDASFAFVVGESYTIIWNGVEYNCTAFESPHLSGMGFVGNPVAVGVEAISDLPFCVGAKNGDVINLQAQDENDAVLTIIATVYVSLSDKFMPSTVPLMVDGKVPASKVESEVFYVPFYKDTTSGEYTCSLTKNEIVDANNAGKLVVGRVNTSGGFYNLLLHGANALYLSFSGYVCDYLADGTIGKNMVVQYDGTTVKVIAT